MCSSVGIYFMIKEIEIRLQAGTYERREYEKERNCKNSFFCVSNLKDTSHLEKAI
jgi:hypothetical protein